MQEHRAPQSLASRLACFRKLRTPSTGESIFRTRCAACHTIGEGDDPALGQHRVGPDLLAVTQRRERTWLSRWLKDPEKMLAEKDPLAVELFARFDNVPMPNLRLGEEDVRALLDYLEAEGRRAAATP